MMPPREEPESVPSAAWTMVHANGRQYRYLVAGKYYVRGYLRQKIWIYTTFDLGSSESVQNVALTDTGFDESTGYLLTFGPGTLPDLVYLHWLREQCSSPGQPSETMNTIFDTILKYGVAA